MNFKYCSVNKDNPAYNKAELLLKQFRCGKW